MNAIKIKEFKKIFKIKKFFNYNKRSFSHKKSID